MALTKAQLMSPPGGPGLYGAVQVGLGLSVSADGVVSVDASEIPTKLEAGNNVILDPPSGVGNCTISTTPAGGGSIPTLATTFFCQASAPPGWTLDTSNPDSALRIVSSSPSSGGSVAASVLWSSVPVTGSVSGSGYTVSNLSVASAQIPSIGVVTVSGSIDATTLNSGNGGGHTHRYSYVGAGTVRVKPGPAQQNGPNTSQQGGSTTTQGQGGSHTHSFSGSGTFNGSPIPHTHIATASAAGPISFVGVPLNLAVKYVDLIAAYKNAP
jgi:hypothetical protein